MLTLSPAGSQRPIISWQRSRSVDPDIERWRRLLNMQTPVLSSETESFLPNLPVSEATRRVKVIPSFPICPPEGRSEYSQRSISAYRPGRVSNVKLTMRGCLEESELNESTLIALDDCIKTQRRLIKCAKGFRRRFVETTAHVQELEEEKLLYEENKRNATFARRIQRIHEEVDDLMQ